MKKAINKFYLLVGWTILLLYPVSVYATFKPNEFESVLKTLNQLIAKFQAIEKQ